MRCKAESLAQYIQEHERHRVFKFRMNQGRFTFLRRLHSNSSRPRYIKEPLIADDGEFVLFGAVTWPTRVEIVIPDKAVFWEEVFRLMMFHLICC